jgi:hypothetical protein
MVAESDVWRKADAGAISERCVEVQIQPPAAITSQPSREIEPEQTIEEAGAGTR